MMSNGDSYPGEYNRKVGLTVVTRNALYVRGHGTDFLFNGYPDVVCGVP